MGVTSVEECFGGRSGSINHLYERRYTRVFDVETDSPYVGPIAVRAHEDIPKIGDYYHGGGEAYGDEFDLGAFANLVDVQSVDEAGHAWKVTVQYEPWEPFSDDPSLRKVRVTFGGERTERVVDFDKAGVPVRNSAGDRFGDPVTVDDHITTMTITRCEFVSDFDLGLASIYSDTINKFAWNGFDAYYLKMGIITTSEEQYDSMTQRWYYVVTYPVQVGRRPWRKDLLDQGFNELTGEGYGGSGDVKTVPIMNEGQPVADPVALDGAGRRLEIGDEPVTLSFDVFDEEDWSGLNINLALRLGA